MATKTEQVHKSQDFLGLGILKNWQLQVLAADPATTYARVYHRSTDGAIRSYNTFTAAWETIGALIIPADTVTNAMLADAPAGSVKANVTGGAANPDDVDIDTAFKAALGLVKADVGLGNVTNDAQLKAADLDNDPTLAANSAVKVPSQQAVKAYADALIGANNAMAYKGTIDASANPNYPAADAGHVYVISVAGKIGGAAGTVVEVGDLALAKVDGSAAGTQAAVGANWDVIQVNIAGAVVGPAASTDSAIALFDGVTGKLLKDSARTIASLVTKYSANIGDGATEDIIVNHALNTRAVTVQVFRNAAPWDEIDVYNERTDANNVTIFFPTGSAPAANAYTAVVIG